LGNQDRQGRNGVLAFPKGVSVRMIG